MLLGQVGPIGASVLGANTSSRALPEQIYVEAYLGESMERGRDGSLMHEAPAMVTFKKNPPVHRSGRVVFAPS